MTEAGDVHIALCQGHWAGTQAATAELYRSLVDEAAAAGATLICLPEFTLLPYFPGVVGNDATRWEETLEDGPTARFCQAAAKKHNATLVASIFEKDGGNRWDTAVIYGPDGKLQHFTRKVHIPSGEGYNETHYFKGHGTFPVHDIGDIRMSCPTCYDQWFPETARICAMNGAELVYFPTAIGSEPTAPDFDSKEAWQTVMRGHAIANGIFIAACNRVGAENGVTFYGSSFICNADGTVLAAAPRGEDAVVHATLRAASRKQYLDLFPLLHQRKPQHYGRLTETTGTAVTDRWKAKL